MCNLKIRKLGQIVLDLSPTLTQLKTGEEEERQTSKGASLLKSSYISEYSENSE